MVSVIKNDELFSKIPWSEIEDLSIFSPSENWPEGKKLPASALTSQHFIQFAVPTEDFEAFKKFIEAIPSPRFHFQVYPVILQTYCEIEQCKEVLIEELGNIIIVLCSIVKTIAGTESPLCLVWVQYNFSHLGFTVFVHINFVPACITPAIVHECACRNDLCLYPHLSLSEFLF